MIPSVASTSGGSQSARATQHALPVQLGQILARQVEEVAAVLEPRLEETDDDLPVAEAVGVLGEADTHLPLQAPHHLGEAGKAEQLLPVTRRQRHQHDAPRIPGGEVLAEDAVDEVAVAVPG